MPSAASHLLESMRSKRIAPAGPAEAESRLTGRLPALAGLAAAAALAAAFALATLMIDRGEDLRLPAAAIDPALSAAAPAPAAGHAFPAAAETAPADRSGGRASALGKLPLAFEPNRGQSDRRVKFLSRGAGYSLFLTAGEAVLSLRPQGPAPAGEGPRSAAKGSAGALAQLPGVGSLPEAAERRGAVLRFGIVGANPDAKVSGLGRLPGHSNYMQGGDPGAWRTGVPNYAKVRYRSVYPGTDLVYYGRQGQLEYDFVLRPGADPGRIALSLSGAEKVRIDGRGDLVLSTPAGEVRQRRPFVYQRHGTERRRIAGRYVLQGKDRVGFSLGAYDRSRALVIDPAVSYSTYLGGSSVDEGSGIAVDSSGIYVTGYTGSTDFPTQNPAQASYNGSSDVFVTKLNPAGSALVYSTYLGGLSADTGRGIAVDPAGNAYVTGSTASLNFPVFAKPPGAPLQPSQGGVTAGISDAFVSKLDATGALSYSTYLGGSGPDSAEAIAVDTAGNAYVTGATEAGYVLIRNGRVPTFPTKDPYQRYPSINGDTNEAFVTKLSFSGLPTDLVYSTYLGGSLGDQGKGIAVDPAGSAYVTGTTSSIDFPVASAVQATKSGGDDAFVTKFSPSGSTLSYSTYLGGGSNDVGYAVAADSAGRAYVTGNTSSTNFPTVSPLQAVKGAGSNNDAFVTKFNPGGALLSSTYFGGSKEELGYGIAVDAGGASAYVTGDTDSTDFPIRNPAQAEKSGGYDAFVSKLSGQPSGALSELGYSTYLGGSGREHGDAVAVDSSTGNAYVTGYTQSTNFPTASPRPGGGAIAGTSDAFVTKVQTAADLSITKTDTPDPAQAGQPLTYALDVQNKGPELARSVSLSDRLPAGVAFVSSSEGCTQASGVVTCSIGDLASGGGAQRQITVRPGAADPALSNTATVQSQTFDPVSENNSATATTDVRPAQSTSADLSIAMTDSPDPVRAGAELTYTLTARNAGPNAAQDVLVRDQLPGGVSFVSASEGCTNTAGLVSCELGALAAGASAEPRQIVVRPTLPNAALSNTATVQSGTGDPDSSNNSATAQTEVRGLADLSITKADSPDPVQVGQDLTYTLTARNLGPDPDPGVTVTDELPSGVSLRSAAGCTSNEQAVTCNLGTLASGATQARTVVVRPTEASPALQNTATVLGAAFDSDPANNTATATTKVDPAQTAMADLSLALSDAPDPVRMGDELTYTLRAENAGPNTAQAVSLRDQLPTEVDFVSASSGCTESGGLVSCPVGELASEATAQRQIVVRPTRANPALQNTATVQSTTSDRDNTNNAATATTEVLARADLAALVTDAPDPVDAGGQLTYGLIARNEGPHGAQGVRLTDSLPSGVSFVSASPGCSQAAGIVSCEIGELEANVAVKREIVVRPTLPDPALRNTVTVQGSTFDPDSSNDSATATTTVRGSAPSGGGGDVPAPAGSPAPPGSPAPVPDTTRPLIGALSLSRTRFRAAGSGPSIAAALGTRVSYALSEPASVSFRVERALSGRRVGGRCVRTTRANRRARSCTRYPTMRGSFSDRGERGSNRFTFRGRLAGRALRPGRYRLRAVATDKAGNKSLLKRTGFRIVRRYAARAVSSGPRHPPVSVVDVESLPAIAPRVPASPSVWLMPFVSQPRRKESRLVVWLGSPPTYRFGVSGGE